jgi:hypothetical protein
MSGVVVVEEAPPPEQAEAIADAAVEVAEIQAERDIAIAEIQAETTETAIEAQAGIEVAEAERVDEWRALYEGLTASFSEQAERINQHEMQITNLTKTVTSQAAAIAALTEQSTLAPPSEPETEAAPEENLGDRREAETEAGIRKRRWM